MIPATILAAESHVLPIGGHAGQQLQALPDDVLAKVVTYFKEKHDFYEWQAAYLTACARVLRGWGLLEAPKTQVLQVAQQHDAVGQAARWYVEQFGKELA